MARPLRLEYPGAIYHVFCRGNERSAIFRKDGDRRTFLAILARVIRRREWRLHSFCLLDNHFHLLLETPLGRLSRGMLALNGYYAQIFNRRYARSGHLFEGRFGAILVKEQEHLLELHRYIVLNPVRAGACARPEDWPWSSYRATIGAIPSPRWLEVGWTLSQFGMDPVEAARSYARFVLTGLSRGSAPAVRRQLFVGGDRFAADIAKRLEERKLDLEIPRVQRQPLSPTVEDVCAAVAREWGVPVESLMGRRASDPRVAAVYLATRVTDLTAGKVGEAFGIRRGRVSNIVRAVEKSAPPPLRSRLARLEAFLKTEIDSQVQSSEVTGLAVEVVSGDLTP